MTDLGAEPALDAEQGDLRDRVSKCLTELFGGQSIPPDLARLLNLGSLPEEKKDMKTPVKERVYKPRHSPQEKALKKEVIKYKSEVQKKEKELQSTMYSERVNGIIARIEKDKKLLKKIFATMQKKELQIDETAKSKTTILSREIDKIKNDIDEINGQSARRKAIMDLEIKKWERKKEQAKTRKALMDLEIKEWERKEEQEKTEMKKSFEEKTSMLDAAKEKTKQSIEAAKQREDEIDREIQNMKDAEAKVEKHVKKNIKAKKKTLAMRKYEFEENIKAMEAEEAEKGAKYDKKIQKLHDVESEIQAKIDSNLAAKRTALAEIQRKLAMLKAMKKTERVVELEDILNLIYKRNISPQPRSYFVKDELGRFVAVTESTPSVSNDKVVYDEEERIDSSVYDDPVEEMDDSRKREARVTGCAPQPRSYFVKDELGRFVAVTESTPSVSNDKVVCDEEERIDSSVYDDPDEEMVNETESTQSSNRAKRAAARNAKKKRY